MAYSKNFLSKANFGISAVIIIGIIAVLNFFSYNIFYRFDLTESDDYSISSVSKKAVGGLDDIVNIKVYFSENLPSQYLNLRLEVGDIIDEYVSYSKGDIKVEFIDPKDDKDLQQELNRSGLPQLQFNILEKDKYQVVNGYLGMIIGYGGKKEVIPVIQDTRNLEYQITLAIKKVTGEIDATIGYVTSNGTWDAENEASIAMKKLEELYVVEKVDLAGIKEIPAGIDTLVIAGPKEKFTDAGQKMIDGFLIHGGSILLLADGVTVNHGLVPAANDLGLDAMLARYGLKLNRDLALDLSSGMASFSQGFVTFSTNYPHWPKVVKQGFDQDNSATSKLESLTLPWVSTIETTGGLDKGNQVSYLARTTENGWRQTENFDLNPQTARQTKNGSKRYDLAVAISGTFQSAFGGQSGTGRLLVVGDSDFMSDNFLQNTPDNLLFFQNIVDSLTLDEDLINIRSKGISERPLKELQEGAKAAVRYLNIFGVTVVAMAFGMARYFLRKRSDFIDEF